MPNDIYPQRIAVTHNTYLPSHLKDKEHPKLAIVSYSDIPLSAMAETKTSADGTFNRANFESLLKRRFFLAESFEIYRTSATHLADNRGLYDYGPPGCALQTNIVNEWRNHFVIEENMMELDCTVITPEPVLKTSGHVDKFADWMCKDPVKGDYLRADHLIESVLEARLAKYKNGSEKQQSEKLDETTAAEYEAILAKVTLVSSHSLFSFLFYRLTTMTAPNSRSSLNNTISETQTVTAKSYPPRHSTSCSNPPSAPAPPHPYIYAPKPPRASSSISDVS